MSRLSGLLAIGGFYQATFGVHLGGSHEEVVGVRRSDRWRLLRLLRLWFVDGNDDGHVTGREGFYQRHCRWCWIARDWQRPRGRTGFAEGRQRWASLGAGIVAVGQGLPRAAPVPWVC